MRGERARPVARVAGLLVLCCAAALFAASCSGEGRANVKAAVSSLASNGLAPTQLPAPTPTRSLEGRPSEAPSETAAPIPSESSGETETPEQSPTEVETTEPPTPSTTEASPPLSFSPSPVENSPSPSESAAATSAAAAESGGSTTWLWIVLALVVVAAIVGFALWMRGRGQRVAAWRSRARDPFSGGVVLHDRLKADLGAPQVVDDRLEQSLAEVDRIGQQLNALTVDAPDDPSQQAVAGLLMALGAVRSALEETRRAPDPAARQSALEPARARVAEFERSLGSFRAAVWPQSTPGGQADTAQ
jgi:hypothetical protein